MQYQNNSNLGDDNRTVGVLLFVFLIIVSFYSLINSLPNFKSVVQTEILSRAQADLAIIAKEPHMMGSDAHKLVQIYLVNELQAIGLEVKIVKTSMLSQDDNVRGAYVENIIAKLKGTSSKIDLPALALMAHYDTRDNTSGAADDGIGVVALLAAARNLIKQPKLQRDVYFIITDGEEFGLFGAQQFFTNNSIRNNIGLVINFEGRGSSGPSTLFETGPNNYSLIGEASKATQVMGSSLSYSVYKIMNNNTDLSMVKQANIQGLNFAFGDGFFDYHTARDTPANVSLQSINDQLNYAIDLSQYFTTIDKLPIANSDSNIDQAQKINDATYFNPIPNVFVFYGELSTYIIGVLALILALIFLTIQFKELKTFVIVKGVLINLWLLAFIAFMITILNHWLYGEIDTEKSQLWRILYQYHLLIVAYVLVVLGLLFSLLPTITSGFNSYLSTTKSKFIASSLLLAFMLVLILMATTFSLLNIIIAIVLVALMWFFRHPINSEAIKIGMLAIWVILLMVLLLLIPAASYLLAWPLLVVSLVRLYQLRFGKLNVMGFSIELLVILLFFIPMVYQIFVFVGHFSPYIPVVLLLMGLLLSSQSFEIIGKSMGLFISVGFILVGLVLIAIINQRTVFNERYSQPSSVYYLQDEVNNKQYWTSNLSTIEGWDKQVLGEDPQSIDSNIIWPTTDTQQQVKSIIKVKLPKAEIVVLEDRIEDEKRYLKLNIKSPMHSEYLNLFLKPIKWYQASIDGNKIKNLPNLQEVTSTKNIQSWWRWRYYAIPTQGITLDLVMQANQPFEMRLVEVIYSGIDKIQLPEMPESYMPMPYGWSNSNVIVQHKEF